MSELYRSTQEHLSENEPKIPILTKGKFGDVDQEVIRLQSNNTSKVYRTSIWLEDFILFSSVFEFMVKSIGWLSLGSFIAIASQISFWLSVSMIPLVWALIFMAYISRSNALKGPVYLFLGLVVFSFIASFV